MNILCLLTKQHKVFKRKDTISRFPVSPGSAKALVRRGMKLRNVPISYLLSNIFAKNYQNRLMYVNVIACQSCELYSETVCLKTAINGSNRRRDINDYTYLLTYKLKKIK